MTPMAWTYLSYVTISVGVTIWVGSQLRKHGGTLVKHGREGLQEVYNAMVHLLVVGFYLLNFGIVSYTLKTTEVATDLQTSIEVLSPKIGLVLVCLGVTHLIMLAIFGGMRKTPDRQPLIPTGMAAFPR